MNQLLRGLLAQDPAVRLSAEEALLLPVFDDFRGTMLPYLEPHGKIYEYEENFDTLFEDDLMPDRSIKSLESRSQIIIPREEVKEHSLFSVRYEGQDPSMLAARQMKKMGPTGKPLSQKSSMFQSSHFQGSSQNSGIQSGSQVSWKDEMSPLTSPQVQLRMIAKQMSGLGTEKKPQGLAQFLVSPSKHQSNMHIDPRLEPKD